MVEDIERTVLLVFDQTGADIIAAQQDVQTRRGIDLSLLHLGPATDGDDAIVGKPAQKWRGRV